MDKMGCDLSYFDGLVALDGPNRPATRVLSGRRECTTRLDFCGLSLDSAELIAHVAAASAGLAEARVVFGGEVENVGVHGYGGEICDAYEVSAVSISVVGWRELTADERVVVEEQVSASQAAGERARAQLARSGSSRSSGRPRLGRLNR